MVVVLWLKLVFDPVIVYVPEAPRAKVDGLIDVITEVPAGRN